MEKVKVIYRIRRGVLQKYKVKIQYQSKSRYSSKRVVDSMLVEIPDEVLTDVQIEAMEDAGMRYPYRHNGVLQLYAEVDLCGVLQAYAGVDPAEGGYSTYIELKALILEQAAEVGIPADWIDF